MSTEIDPSSPPESGRISEYEDGVKPTSDPAQLLPWIPRTLSGIIAEQYRIDPKLFEMEEYALEKHIRKCDQDISNRDEGLRARFWYCYDKASYNMKAMTIVDLCAGLMHPATFYHVYVTNRFKLAWMLCKPTEIKIQDIALLTLGKRKMDQVLRMDPVDPVTNKTDYKLIALQIAIYKNVENRVLGLPVQRIHQKNLNFNTDISNTEMAKELEGRDAIELRNRLQDLKTVSLKSLPPVPKTPDSSPGNLSDVEVERDE